MRQGYHDTSASSGTHSGAVDTATAHVSRRMDVLHIVSYIADSATASTIIISSTMCVCIGSHRMPFTRSTSVSSYLSTYVWRPRHVSHVFIVTMTNPRQVKPIVDQVQALSRVSPRMRIPSPQSFDVTFRRYCMHGPLAARCVHASATTVCPLNQHLHLSR